MRMGLGLWQSQRTTGGGTVAAPVNTVLPVITGTAQTGQVLTGSDGTWTGSPTFTRQWTRDAVNIGGETNSTYTTLITDAGKTIDFVVTGTNAGGSIPATATGVAITMALPSQGNLIADWNADSLAVVADGTSVTSWTDSISGFVLSQGTGAAPTYKNNGIGTRAGLDFNGSNQWLTGPAAAIMTAQAAKNITVMIVMTNTAAPTGNFGFAFNLTSSTGVNWRHSGTTAGLPSGSEIVPYTSAGFTTGGYMYTSAYYTGHTTQHQVMLNGSLISQGNTAMSTTGVTQPGIGATSNGTGPYKGRIARVLVWNRKLTLNEWLQAERAVRDYYGQAYPWTTPGYYMVNVGDSISYGYGTTGRDKAWPYKLATALSLPFGAWSNLGFIGSNAVDCGNIIAAEALSSIAATIGVPVKSTYFEFYNQRALITNPIASSTAVTTTQATLTALKACGKVLFADCTDYKSRASVKGDWTTYWGTPANQTGYMDAFVALSSDVNIGVDLACPDSPPYGAYFSNALVNFTCNATVASGTDLLTINSMTTGNGNVVVGASVVGTGVPAGTTIASLGTGAGGTGTYHMSANATSTNTGTYSGGTGDGIHPGDGAQDTFVSNFQTPFAAM